MQSIAADFGTVWYICFFLFHIAVLLKYIKSGLGESQGSSEADVTIHGGDSGLHSHKLVLATEEIPPMNLTTNQRHIKMSLLFYLHTYHQFTSVCPSSWILRVTNSGTKVSVTASSKCHWSNPHHLTIFIMLREDLL